MLNLINKITYLDKVEIIRSLRVQMSSLRSTRLEEYRDRWTKKKTISFPFLLWNFFKFKIREKSTSQSWSIGQWSTRSTMSRVGCTDPGLMRGSMRESFTSNRVGSADLESDPSRYADLSYAKTLLFRQPIKG